jgi:S1-C subfamily serine protease
VTWPAIRFTVLGSYFFRSGPFIILARFFGSMKLRWLEAEVGQPRVADVISTIGSVAIGLAVLAIGVVTADADTPLPVLERANGLPSVARLVEKILPRVVSIQVKVRAPERRAAPRGSGVAPIELRRSGKAVMIRVTIPEERRHRST